MTRAINTRIAEMLGLKGRHLTKLDLRLRLNESPTLTTTELLIDGSKISTETQVFDVVLREQPFDLDRACEKALQRVNASIQSSADRAHRTVKALFAKLTPTARDEWATLDGTPMHREAG